MPGHHRHAHDSRACLGFADQSLTLVGDGLHERHGGGARWTLKPLKLGQRARNPFLHMPARDHVVVADIRVPRWVDGEPLIVRVRQQRPRQGVARAPVKSPGVGNTCSRAQSGPPQTSRRQQSGCYPKDGIPHKPESSASGALPSSGNTRCSQHRVHIGPFAAVVLKNYRRPFAKFLRSLRGYRFFSS